MQSPTEPRALARKQTRARGWQVNSQYARRKFKVHVACCYMPVNPPIIPSAHNVVYERMKRIARIERIERETMLKFIKMRRSTDLKEDRERRYFVNVLRKTWNKKLSPLHERISFTFFCPTFIIRFDPGFCNLYEKLLRRNYNIVRYINNKYAATRKSLTFFSVPAELLFPMIL